MVMGSACFGDFVSRSAFPILRSANLPLPRFVGHDKCEANRYTVQCKHSICRFSQNVFFFNVLENKMIGSRVKVLQI